MSEIFWQLMTDEEYQKLKNLIETAIGVKLNANKKDFVENLLIKRFHVLGIPDFKTYYALVNNDEQEFACLINAITNVSTHFFRESYHFEYMVAHILPELIASKQKLRLWSAGCSTGEEAYSIGITLYESIPDIDQYDVKILATDVNTEALEIAQLGIYDESHSKELSKHPETFHVIQSNNPKKIQINDTIKDLISFKKLNLLEPWPMKNKFDIIFCRNVTIYLKPETTHQLLAQFDQLLNVGGCLFLGHSESLNLFQDRYVCLGKTMYQKVG